MKKFTLLIMKLFILFFLFSTNVLVSQTHAQGKMSGYMMAYYFHDLSPDGPATNGQNNEVIIKRIYLHYDYQISERFETRVTLEMNQNNIGNSNNYEPYVKFAFLRWKNIIPRGELLLGLSQSPVWANEENLWHYWSVEKTLFDIRSLGHPCDMGIALKGKFDSSEIFGYHIMIGQGNGHKPETDKYKKFYSSISFEPKNYLFFEIVTDYEKKNTLAEAKTIKGLAAIKGENWLMGFETGRRYDGHLNDIIRQGISLFGRAELSQHFNILGRYDNFNWNKDINETGDSLYIFGIDYQPHKQVHVIPNIWITSYKDKKLYNDMIGKISLHFVFN